MDTLGKLNEVLGGREAEDEHGFISQIDPIYCVDGFVMSVQASKHHYCSPRSNCGPWESVEVGFPSERDDKLMPFVADEHNPTETVYGWVPVHVVASVIDAHGGFLTGKEDVK